MKKTVIILIISFLLIGSAGCKNIRKANIKVSSEPSEAEVYINGELKGKTPLTLTLAYGTYQLELKKSGYKDIKKELTVNGKTKDINIALTENSQFVINVDPEQNYTLLKFPYTVYLDGNFTGKTTPCKLENVPEGVHIIKLVSPENILEKTVNLTQNITISYIEEPANNYFHNLSRSSGLLSSIFDLEDYSEQYVKEMKWNVFNNDKPLVDICCSPAGRVYSNIFANETVNISGYIEKEATETSFDIVFPSGKKVHIDSKEENGYRVFSKKVTFNEIGKYTIGGSPFYVFYKATPLPPVKTAEELFGRGDGTVVIPEDTEETIKLFITDANGKPIVNKPIGKYGAKTDANGIVTLKVKGECGFGGLTVNGENVGVRLYGALLGWVYHSTTLSKKDVDIKYMNGDIYIPKTQVLGYFNDKDIKNTKTINGKEYADLDTLSDNGLGSAVIITDSKIEFLKMCDMIP